MQLMPLGDYYYWYCEWCDSKNLTPWSAATKSEVCCAACQKKFSMAYESVSALKPERQHPALSAFH